jgi:hypothetical protein
MEIEQQIRRLARSSHYQSLYRSAKDIGTLQLFENQSNFSGLQSLFLFWLSVYESLFTDLAQKEWRYLDEDVINNDVRCDAFIYWRSKAREDELDKYKREQKVSKLKFKSKGETNTFNVDFNG